MCRRRSPVTVTGFVAGRTQAPCTTRRGYSSIGTVCHLPVRHVQLMAPATVNPVTMAVNCWVAPGLMEGSLDGVTARVCANATDPAIRKAMVNCKQRNKEGG